MASTARTVEFSRDATNVFFHILTRCNLKCRHCYINPLQHGAADLPLATANVIFLGGEPTLHPDLAGAIRAARRLGYASVTVDTNGYLFHDILNQVTPKEVDFFSFSLDGPEPAVNDPIRGKGSFAHCTAGIRAARRRGFRASLIYTVSSDNIEALGRMPPLLAELGVERFFIQVIGIRGKSAERAGNQERLQVSRADWLAAVAPVARAVAAQGITVTWPKVYLNIEEPFECAGRVAENFFIFPNGRVYRCPLCEDFPLHAFTIEENRLTPTVRINETDLFSLDIPEGCVMNRLVQPANIEYDADGKPLHRIACCLLKEEISPH
ncbi:MAG: radical SAM protein [Deltaproteobacteria bacterium]|nr:radical SAM protein [Deltaproteobacteria bacterium]